MFSRSHESTFDNWYVSLFHSQYEKDKYLLYFANEVPDARIPVVIIPLV